MKKYILLLFLGVLCGGEHLGAMDNRRVEIKGIQIPCRSFNMEFSVDQFDIVKYQDNIDKVSPLLVFDFLEKKRYSDKFLWCKVIPKIIFEFCKANNYLVTKAAKTVWFYKVTVDADLVKAFFMLPDIKNFNFMDAKISSRKKVIRALPKYTEGVAFVSNGIDDNMVKDLSENCKKLKELTVTFNRYLTDGCFEYIKKFEKLKVLNLGSNEEITSDGLVKFFDEYHKINPDLKIISISKCDVTDEVLQKVSKFKELEHLRIICCDKVTDEGIKYFRNHTGLRELHFRGTGVTKKVLLYIPTSLNEFSVDRKITEDLEGLCANKECWDIKTYGHRNRWVNWKLKEPGDGFERVIEKLTQA